MLNFNKGGKCSEKLAASPFGGGGLMMPRSRLDGNREFNTCEASPVVHERRCKSKKKERGGPPRQREVVIRCLFEVAVFIYGKGPIAGGMIGAVNGVVFKGWRAQREW